MEVLAKLRFLRMAPRKVRLVVDTIRGLPVEKAEYQLTFLEKRATAPVFKLLKSAVANAENNFKLKKDNLYIKRAIAEEGPTLKRFQPRAFGRATPIRKRSTHILIVLEEKVGKEKEELGKKKSELKAKSSSLPKEKEIEKVSSPEEIPSEDKGKAVFEEKIKEKGRLEEGLSKMSLKRAKGFAKRIFRRKST